MTLEASADQWRFLFIFRFPNVRACLFDMDGLLLDTEDIYTACNNVILQEYGRPKLPWKIKAQLQGRPAPQVCFSFALLLHIQFSSSLTITYAVFGNLSCLGPTSYFPRRIYSQAGRPASSLLSNHTTPSRNIHSTQNAQIQLDRLIFLLLLRFFLIQHQCIQQR